MAKTTHRRNPPDATVKRGTAPLRRDVAKLQKDVAAIRRALKRLGIAVA